METLVSGWEAARDSAVRHPLWAGVVLAATLASFLRAVRPKKKHGPRMRSTSFGTTKLLVSGTPGCDNNHSLICIIAELDPMPSKDALVAAFANTIVPYQRFHSVPRQDVPCGEVTWVPVKVDVGAHFVVHDVPSQDVGRGVIDRVINKPLHRKKSEAPWWDVQLVVRRDGAAGSMVVRVHHALGDGVSLMEAFAPMLTDVAGKPLDLGNSFAPGKRGPKRGSIFGVVRNAFGAVHSALKVLGYPAVGGDTPSAFNSPQRSWPYRDDKIVVYLPTHRLDVIKEIKNKAGHGTTVNDVEFALYAGMLRRFLQKHDPKCPDMSKAHMRALTPLALLEKADPLTKYMTLLRNGWTFIVNDLPVAPPTALDRLRASHKSWDGIKNSTVVPVSFFMHRLASSLPWSFQKQTTIDLGTHMSTVFSNVPGPQEPTYICGGRLTDCFMSYPNLNPQTGIISVDGRVSFCVTMSPDPNGVDVRAALPACFREEMTELCVALGVDPSRAFV